METENGKRPPRRSGSDYLLFQREARLMTLEGKIERASAALKETGDSLEELREKIARALQILSP